MKPAAFDYLRAESAEEALAGLAEAGPEARIVAGGQSLLPMLNMRLARPALLIDIMRIEGLARVGETKAGLRIGAGVRQEALRAHPALGRHPLLAACLPWVGHAQTRSRGTICGSIAHADPAAELPLVLLALGGTVHLRSRRRRRDVAADAFFLGMMATARQDDEMIEAVTFPAALGGPTAPAGTAFSEISRRHGDFAIVACAAVADGRGSRLAVGGVADRPVARDLPPPADPALGEALNEFAWSLEARDDLHATAAYRRALVRELGRRTIEEAAQCRA